MGAILQLGISGGRQAPWAQDRAPCHVLGVSSLVVIPWTTSQLDGPSDLRFGGSIFPDTFMFEEQGVCECGVMY